MKFVFEFPDGSNRELEVGDNEVEGTSEALSYLQQELGRKNTPITSKIVGDLYDACVVRAQRAFPKGWMQEPNLCAITQIKQYLEAKDSHKARASVRSKSERRVSFSDVLETSGEEVPVVCSGKKASVLVAGRADEFATPADQRKPVVSPDTRRRANRILDKTPRAMSASPTTVFAVSEDKSPSVMEFSPIGTSPVSTSNVTTASTWRKSPLAIERSQSQPLPVTTSPSVTTSPLLTSWSLEGARDTFYKVVDRGQDNKPALSQSPAPSHKP